MNRIKSIICVILAAVMVTGCVLFSSCKGDSDNETKPGVPDVELNSEKIPEGNKTPSNEIDDKNVSALNEKGGAQYILSTLSDEYAAGDTVTVSVWLKDSPLTATLDFYVVSDVAQYVENKVFPFSDFIINADGAENTYRVMGMVATTCDIELKKLAQVTFKLPEDAVPGDEITFMGQVGELSRGLDASGNEIESIKDKIVAPVLTVKVK